MSYYEPAPIYRKKEILIPPISQIKPQQNWYGIEMKQFPSNYWGNTIYKTTNGMIFDNYYDAMSVQQLIYLGLCDKDILKRIPHRPIYIPIKKNPNLDYGYPYSNKIINDYQKKWGWKW